MHAFARRLGAANVGSLWAFVLAGALLCTGCPNPNTYTIFGLGFNSGALPRYGVEPVATVRQ